MEDKMKRTKNRGRCSDVNLSDGVESVTTGYHDISVRRVEIQNATGTKCCQRYGATAIPIQGWPECSTVLPLWETIWWFFTKLNIHLPNHQATILLGSYPKETKACVHPNTCTGRFTAALSIIATTWKQPRCSSGGDWISKLWYIETVEHLV